MNVIRTKFVFFTLCTARVDKTRKEMFETNDLPPAILKNYGKTSTPPFAFQPPYLLQLVKKEHDVMILQTLLFPHAILQEWFFTDKEASANCLCTKRFILAYLRYEICVAKVIKWLSIAFKTELNLPF